MNSTRNQRHHAQRSPGRPPVDNFDEHHYDDSFEGRPQRSHQRPHQNPDRFTGSSRGSQRNSQQPHHNPEHFSDFHEGPQRSHQRPHLDRIQDTPEYRALAEKYRALEEKYKSLRIETDDLNVLNRRKQYEIYDLQETLKGIPASYAGKSASRPYDPVRNDPAPKASKPVSRPDDLVRNDSVPKISKPVPRPDVRKDCAPKASTATGSPNPKPPTTFPKPKIGKSAAIVAPEKIAALVAEIAGTPPS